jgi:nanoRNase/pAp phosphatase (c-di-AMP/oligoRNAs hydrolase)
MWFDHHISETMRIGRDVAVKGEYRPAPSAARVIYEYYGGKDILPQFDEFVAATDKVDSGQLTRDEILNPTDWVLLGYIMDPRTGLGRFREFTISNYQLMENLIDACATLSISEILNMPDVKERLELYYDHAELFKQMVHDRTTLHTNVICTDLRGVSPIFVGNRFMVYGLYPDQNVSVWVVDGRAGVNCAIAVGYSILNRTCDVNIGELMLKHGGGGHKMVGTCQVPYEKADEAIKDIIKNLQA